MQPLLLFLRMHAKGNNIVGMNENEQNTHGQLFADNQAGIGRSIDIPFGCYEFRTPDRFWIVCSHIERIEKYSISFNNSIQAWKGFFPSTHLHTKNYFHFIIIMLNSQR